MDTQQATVPTQVLSQDAPMPQSSVAEKRRLSISPHLSIFLAGTLISIILFLLIVRFMQIPGILVMIAVSISNGVSQLLIQPKKRFVWGPLALVTSALLIMGVSWYLVNQLHA